MAVVALARYLPQRSASGRASAAHAGVQTVGMPVALSHFAGALQQTSLDASAKLITCSAQSSSGSGFPRTASTDAYDSVQDVPHSTLHWPEEGPDGAPEVEVPVIFEMSIPWARD